MSEKIILLIDDEGDFCLFVKLNLEKTGRYKVFTATDGKKGISLAKQHQPDLILLDIKMSGMDGGQVAELLLEDEWTSEIPIVFLTAMVREEEVSRRGGRFGGRDFIAKPIAPGALMEKIEFYLSKVRA